MAIIIIIIICPSDLHVGTVRCAGVCRGSGGCSPGAGGKQRSGPHPDPGGGQVPTGQGEEPSSRHRLPQQGNQRSVSLFAAYTPVAVHVYWDHLPILLAGISLSASCTVALDNPGSSLGCLKNNPIEASGGILMQIFMNSCLFCPSGTVSKLDFQTHSHLSNHLLNLNPSSCPIQCVCVCVCVHASGSLF